jgi:cell division protease FtsH
MHHYCTTHILHLVTLCYTVEFGKSQSKIQLQPDTGTKFADVAGCDAAKLELEEVVDFLKNSTKYTDLGAQIPRGVILEGPPG